MAFLDVSQTSHSAPHYGIARRRVVGARKITTELSEPDNVARERRSLRVVGRIVNEVFKQFDFGVRERESGCGPRRRSPGHGEPEYAPAQDAKDCDQVGSLSAVRSRDSSALQPDFRILWKVSIFQRIAYQSSFSIASARERTGRLVISVLSMRARPGGGSRSCACRTVSCSAVRASRSSGGLSRREARRDGAP
ncbi:hypothetical protein LMG29542_07469 [Paraburkholderia humisilvae]|uniref:Uncharacterized protein n=1 Tax=Paraburkholderia humisilvae TaxID=627669 RepID=A0A6J5F7S9_9BURK|nr:hypothetical protein LMG29542_07469 [Paraburkholderia humisilvae]